MTARRTLTLHELTASSPAPDRVAAVLQDEVRRGRVERIGDAYALTVTAARELRGLRQLTERGER